MLNGVAPYIVLPLVGLLAGIINTLAGGGSLITIPALLVLGLPATVANTTNRIPIVLHSASASWQYWKRGVLKTKPFVGVVAPTVLGALAGSLSFRTVTDSRFNIVLAFLIVVLVISLYVKPQRAEHPMAHGAALYRWWIYAPVFAVIGFYGGFLQIGVGLILIPAIYYFVKTNLVETNALKVATIFCFSLPSLFLLGASNAPIWRYGLLMGVGSIAGGYIGVKISLTKRGEAVIRVALTLVACATALYLIRENRALIRDIF